MKIDEIRWISLSIFSLRLPLGLRQLHSPRSPRCRTSKAALSSPPPLKGFLVKALKTRRWNLIHFIKLKISIKFHSKTFQVHQSSSMFIDDLKNSLEISWNLSIFGALRCFCSGSTPNASSLECWEILRNRLEVLTRVDIVHSFVVVHRCSQLLGRHFAQQNVNLHGPHIAPGSCLMLREPESRPLSWPRHAVKWARGHVCQATGLCTSCEVNAIFPSPGIARQRFCALSALQRWWPSPWASERSVAGWTFLNLFGTFLEPFLL